MCSTLSAKSTFEDQIKKFSTYKLVIAVFTLISGCRAREYRFQTLKLECVQKEILSRLPKWRLSMTKNSASYPSLTPSLMNKEVYGGRSA